jgi:hypothetical protein
MNFPQSFIFSSATSANLQFFFFSLSILSLPPLTTHLTTLLTTLRARLAGVSLEAVVPQIVRHRSLIPPFTAIDFPLDAVFSPTSTTRELFDAHVLPAVSKAKKEGFNCTVLAYGQTGSGKTHTMSGTAEEDGVVQRAVRELLRDDGATGRGEKVSIKAAFLEIYNEKVYDLYNLNEVALREDYDKNVIVQGITEHVHTFS